MFRSTWPTHRPTEDCWCWEDICHTVMATTQRWWWISTHWVCVWAPWVHSHHLDQSGECSTRWADLWGYWPEWNHQLLFPCQRQEQTWSQLPSWDRVDCQAQEQIWLVCFRSTNCDFFFFLWIISFFLSVYVFFIQVFQTHLTRHHETVPLGAWTWS